jgi:hypothetical protein
VRRLAIAVFVACAARIAFAQGGPPMITDDPGTPGDRKWEINLAIAFEHRPNETSYDAPEIDLNYGVGDRIQLTLQTAPVLLKRNDRGPIGGLGGTEAALKWRFLDQETNGFDMSMFPRVIFNVTQSSVRRGLAEDGTRFQIPFQIAKTLGRFHADAECGPVGVSVGRSEWLYGIVGGVDVAKPTMLMAELHGTSRINFTRDTLTLNFGWRHKINEHAIWIASFGHELRAPEQDALALIGYCGVQLLY